MNFPSTQSFTREQILAHGYLHAIELAGPAETCIWVNAELMASAESLSARIRIMLAHIAEFYDCAHDDPEFNLLQAQTGQIHQTIMLVARHIAYSTLPALPPQQFAENVAASFPPAYLSEHLIRLHAFRAFLDRYGNDLVQSLTQTKLLIQRFVVSELLSIYGAFTVATHVTLPNLLPPDNNPPPEIVNRESLTSKRSMIVLAL